MKKLFALMLALMLALAGISAVSAEDAAAAETTAPEAILKEPECVAPLLIYSRPPLSTVVPVADPPA